MPGGKWRRRGSKLAEAAGPSAAEASEDQARARYASDQDWANQQSAAAARSQDLRGQDNQQLRPARLAAGLTFNELSKRSGIAESRLRAVEDDDGGTQLSLREWLEICWSLVEPWPSPHRTESHQTGGWVALEGELFVTAQSIVRRQIDAGGGNAWDSSV